MHHTVTEANCPLSDIVSMPEMTSGLHHFEESGQFVLLNAFDVMPKNSNTTLDFCLWIQMFSFTVHYTFQGDKKADIHI